MARVEAPPLDDYARFVEWFKEEFAPHIWRSQKLSVTFGAADTEVRVRHDLAAVPEGYVVIDSDRACAVYRDSATTAADSRYIYLKCDTASAVVTVRVL